MLVNMKEMLEKARRSGFAVGFFDTVNEEMARAVIETAEELQAPVIVGTAEILLPVMGLDRVAEMLIPLAEKGKLELPAIPEGCVHNAHMYYIKLKNLEERGRMIRHLKERKIGSVFHYIPLHSAPAGLRFGRFSGEDQFTTKESERLTRLPMYYGLREEEIREVAEAVNAFFQ